MYWSNGFEMMRRRQCGERVAPEGWPPTRPLYASHVQVDLDPLDIATAIHEWGYHSAQLFATVHGRTLPVVNISPERQAYEVEHWERIWVPAKDVTKLVGTKIEKTPY